MKLSSPKAKQVWLADDATGAGSITDLKTWWDTIISDGKKLGYTVNEKKSWLILKDCRKLNEVKLLFSNTAIQVTTEGKRHLGAAIGSDEFREKYANDKVKMWCDEMEKLAEYAKTQPQAAFAAFIHGETHRFSYFLRTIPGMEKFVKPLDEVINDKFLPALIGTSFTGSERELFSLPISLGGLSIPI